MATTTVSDGVGLNKDKVSAMKTALDKYIQSVDDEHGAIKNIAVNATTLSKGIKGEGAQKIVQDHLKTVRKTLSDYFEALAKHKQKIDTMYNAYLNQDKNG